MAYAPSVTVQTDAAPVPRAELLFATVPASTERATVYRITGTRQFRVRGAINIYAAGGFSLPDTEIPFNVTVTYRAEFFNAAGTSLGFSDGTDALCEVFETWIHLPTDPSRNAIIDPLPEFGAELTRPFNGSVVYPLGRSEGVFIGSGRKGLTDVSLDSATDSLTQADSLTSVFGEHGNPSIPVVCIRTQPIWRLPMPLFAAVLAPSERRLTVGLGGEVIYWRMRGDEVSPPVEALVMALLRYSDIEAISATYSGLEAAYLTYLGIESDYSKAGTA